MQVSVRLADGLVMQIGDALGGLDGCEVRDVPDNVASAIRDVLADARDAYLDGDAVTARDREAVVDALAALRDAIHAADDAVGIDPTLVTTALSHLDAIIDSGTLPDLPASPTNAAVVAQVRALTVAVNRLADATRDLARFDRAVIRLLA
jgi:hypothetical protein